MRPGSFQLMTPKPVRNLISDTIGPLTICVDVNATNRALAFKPGWFSDPVYLGTYPSEMRETLGTSLPEFTEDEWKLVKGSSDFFGLNTYTTHLIRKSRLLLMYVPSLTQYSLSLCRIEDNGEEVFHGNVKLGFTKPDGTQLGIECKGQTSH